MIDKCPGQDFRNLEAENITCPNCGYLAEIFSNEFRIECFKCGNQIIKQKLPSCIDWCRSAKDCIGEEKWEQLKLKG